MAMLHIDFGVKLTGGKKLEYSKLVDICGDVPLLRAHLECTFKASLGLSFYEQMVLVVGRINTLNPNWIRVRLEREKESRLTLGVLFALQASYDLGSGLEAILDHAFGLTPMVRIFAVIKEIKAVAKEVNAGNWDAIKDKLTESAQATLSDYLNDSGWPQWAANSDKAKKLFEVINTIVDTYEKLDETIMSLWERLLGYADLKEGSKARKLIRDIANIDLATVRVDDFLKDSNLKNSIDLIEALSGKSIEGMLLDPGYETTKSLQKAIDVAKKTEDFLTKVPNDFLKQVKGFAERSGIKSAIDWLKDNATSATSLTDFAVQKVARFVVDKAWDSLSAADLQRIQDLAGKLSKNLDRMDEWNTNLRNDLKKLKGEMGLSIALEVGRVSRTTALIDLEFDPTNDAILAIMKKQLPKGNARGLLNDLPDGDSKNNIEPPEPLPYQLRECLFTSKLIRTSVASQVLNMLGFQTKGRRFAEAIVRVEQKNNLFSREARYLGGYERTESDIFAKSFGATTWVEISANGEGKDLSKAYGELKDIGLRLAICRDDEDTPSDELAAVDAILSQLGFHGAWGTSIKDTVPSGWPTRFALQINFQPTGLAEFLGLETDITLWDRDFLNAAHRWYDEDLIPLHMPRYKEFRLGEVIANLTHDRLFQETWTKGTKKFENEFNHKPVSIKKNNENISVYLINKNDSKQVWENNFWSLMNLISARGIGYVAVGKSATAYNEAVQSKKPADLAEFCRRFAGSQAACFPGNWQNPLFDFWLVLARLWRRNPEILSEAHGFASFRWQDKGVWTEPLVWTLPNGIKIGGLGSPETVFPFSETNYLPKL